MLYMPKVLLRLYSWDIVAICRTKASVVLLLRVQLVAGKGVQVAAQFLNVHIHVGNSLGSVNQHDGFPVSYTHLDVYKRQAPFLRSGRRGRRPHPRASAAGNPDGGTGPGR